MNSGQKLEFLGCLIGVERVTRPTGLQAGQKFLSNPVIDEDIGIVVHLGPDQTTPLKVGDKIYFGKDRSELRVAGKDLLVMKPDNVIAKVNED
jgi:co-chaperonin GroES (HSP10)